MFEDAIYKFYELFVKSKEIEAKNQTLEQTFA